MRVILYQDEKVIVGIEGDNEFAVYPKRQAGKPSDPSKIRLGGQEGSLGAISFNKVDDNGANPREMVLVQGKDHDPDPPDDLPKCGSFDVQVVDPAFVGTDDQKMRKGLLLTPFRLNARVPFEQGSGGSPPSPWPATAPVARDGSGGGAQFIPTYQSYPPVSASAARKALIQTYYDKYHYIDNVAFNWIVFTFIDSGLVQ